MQNYQRGKESKVFGGNDYFELLEKVFVVEAVDVVEIGFIVVVEPGTAVDVVEPTVVVEVLDMLVLVDAVVVVAGFAVVVVVDEVVVVAVVVVAGMVVVVETDKQDSDTQTHL